jgi:hypothetical protein
MSNVDDLITAVTEAPAREFAMEHLLNATPALVRAVADQLCLATHTGQDRMRRAILDEARA